MNFCTKAFRFCASARLALTVAALLTLPWSARADLFRWDVAFTTFAGGENVNRVRITYDDVLHSLTLGPVSNIASTPGADGIVSLPDRTLGVGGQSRNAYKVALDGTFTSQPSPTDSFDLMMAPDGTLYTTGGPGDPSSFDPLLTTPGTAHTIVGSEAGVGITSMAWTGSDPLHAFYTSSDATGFGNFGQIDLTDPSPSTFVTTRLITGLPAAHDITFDTYTGDLLLAGDGHVTQIDPTNPSVTVSDLDLSGRGFVFDHVIDDGQGHVFAASNDGRLLFVDIRQSRLIGDPDYSTSPFLDPALDALTFLVPEPSALTLIGIGGSALLGCRWRRRRLGRETVG
jgi:hypothetical protein